MTTITLDNKKVKNGFSDILKSLSDKERNVIERRVGLFGDRETLQSIGNSFSPSITRERVRQIEDNGIKKIGRIIKATFLIEVQNKATEFLNMHGGVLTKEKLINAIIKDLRIGKEAKASILELIIQSDYDIKKSKPKFGALTYFYLPNISKKQIEAVHKEAVIILKRKRDVMENTVLYTAIAKNLKKEYSKLNNLFIDSSLDIFEDIVKGEETLVGLAKWKILNPKTLKDKAIYVMKKEKVPMHFMDISNKITGYLGEAVKVNTIHNELIRNNEFVLIGKGIYALKEWGFVPGTVIDVIISMFEKHNRPMTTDEITSMVLKTRNVKKTTIYMNLQNKKIIERVGRNYYQLKK